MLIDGALHFASSTNYLGLQFRGTFIIVLKKQGNHPLARVALSLNVKNAVLTSETVYICVHVPVSRPSDVAMTMIHFHCPSADVFYRERRFIATVQYSADSELYKWITFETGVLCRMKMGHSC